MSNSIFKNIDFKGLLPYIQDPDVTDINCRNDSEVWLTSNSLGHHKIDIAITKEDIMTIANQVANRMEKEFNPAFPCLEGDIEGSKIDIRISAIHPHLSCNGTSLAIRKVTKNQILNDDYLITSNYVTKECLELLKKLVRAGCNILVIGETGCGKTELLKYLSNFIPHNQLIATIEDSLEFNIKSINPQASCTSFRVRNGFSYSSLIAMCLRQNIDWILLQEARGIEVNDLLEAMSTGHSVMTTLHAKSAVEVDVRIKQMLHDSNESLQSLRLRLYSLVDIVIHIKKVQLPQTHRYIESIYEYYYDNQNDACVNNQIYKANQKLKPLSKVLKEKIR